MDNNKRKPKLVAEHPAAWRRRRWDGRAGATCDNLTTWWRPVCGGTEERQTWRPGYTRYVIANRCYHEAACGFHHDGRVAKLGMV